MTVGMTTGIPATKRDRLDLMSHMMELERSTFLKHWQEIANHTHPRRVRSFTTDANKGDKRNQNIVDSTATLSGRVLAAGMTSGVTSPHRPWMQLTTADFSLREMPEVKLWFHIATEIVLNAFERSNFYNEVPTWYLDLGHFGSSCMISEVDPETVSRFHMLPIGSYSLDVDENGLVNTVYREFTMTVWQLVEKFGFDNDEDRFKRKINWSHFSSQVKESYDNKQYQIRFDVCHMINPNPNYRPGNSLGRFKKFESSYYEKGNTTRGVSSEHLDRGLYLRESGFDIFPALGGRWSRAGEDIYGTDCPGMTALGDIKQLQKGEKKSLRAVDKMIDPAMKGPPSLLNEPMSLLPGGVTLVDESNRGRFEPSHTVSFPIDSLESKQQQVRLRIDEAYYKTLFLMLLNDRRSNVTATEIIERKQEQLIALAPLYDNVRKDMLEPVVEMMFIRAVRQGRIPQPPDVLKGQPLKVEVVSIMAQAQKMATIDNVERLLIFSTQIAQLDPSVRHKVNSFNLLDHYANRVGTPPGIIRSDQDAGVLLQQEQQAIAQQQQMQAMSEATKSAKNLAQSDTEGDNALTKLLGLTGAGTS